jgi:membrane protein implicated in regulation of membrane protease activity
VVAEAKKATKGAIYFIIAAVVLLYSSFFFFFALGYVLYIWLSLAAAFGIVFGLMLISAAVFGLLGWRKVKKLKAPQRTIDSFKDTAAALKPGKHTEDELPSVGA